MRSPSALITCAAAFPPCSRPGWTGRRENLRDAFAAAAPLPNHACIGLVDDVVTTASTLAACARAVERAGAWPAPS
ncbi:MAG: hypothetical protein FJY95_02385 [Candidatus Handelsmanbacteria bacterium]|nr:hypothetical protein [Candidatus Handelsmanbacteria bacterium]